MFESIDDLVDKLGAQYVLEEMRKHLREGVDVGADHCGDPRCAVHGEFATSYRNPVLMDIHRYHGNHSPSIEWTVVERSLSCTGPVEVVLEFKRDLLQNLEIGDETVTVTLTEPVV